MSDFLWIFFECIGELCTDGFDAFYGVFFGIRAIIVGELDGLVGNIFQFFFGDFDGVGKVWGNEEEE